MAKAQAVSRKTVTPRTRARAEVERQVTAPNNARRATGFDAGKTGRRLRAIPSTALAINSQIRQYGKNVVARSRYLAVNNAYASAAKEEYVAAMVGTGIKPASLVKDKKVKAQIALKFKKWTDEADADGLTDYYGLQGIVASEMFEAGECFVRIRTRFASDGLTVPFQLQLLPAEMLPTDHNEVLANGTGRIECGIEFNAIGQRVAYWFLRNHPGELNSFASNPGTMKVRVPATEVLHLFKPIRAGQIRGLPHTLAGIVTLAMIDLYDDAELERKRIAALFGAFIKREAGNPDAAGSNPFAGAAETPNTNNTDVSDFTLEPGAVIDLEAGQDVVFSEPADVGVTYEMFQYRNLLRAAAGFGATYSGMTGDLKTVNYSSIRAGLVAFRRRIEAQQHHVMIFQFCRPIWNRWFTDAMKVRALPLISASAFLADPDAWTDVKHNPPKWEWVDPLKDRQAEKLAVDSGFKARSDVIEAEGYDPEEVDARILADQERAGALGIKFIQIKSGFTLAPTDEEPEELPPTEPAPAPAPAPGKKPAPVKKPVPAPRARRRV